MVAPQQAYAQRTPLMDDGQAGLDHEGDEGEVAQDAGQQETGSTAITAELLLHPLNTSAQALWLCQRLKQSLGAEVIYLTGTPKGTVIRISIRNPVALVDFLSEMSEVAEAWEEETPREIGMELPIRTALEEGEASHEQGKIVCVALKPSASA